ncbi:MAG TPA: ABC transporter permease, partial [Vicinamibacterales bacterium]|nr:ABC transporter permease [Vicinamibacterales bacterium]
FEVLGAAPIAGRTFRPGDPADVIVISEALWTRLWRRDPSIVGRTVRLGTQPVTVLGVMPDRFQFPYRASSVVRSALPESRTDLWRPFPAAAAGAARRGRVSVVARLRPGVSIDAATADLRALAANLSAAAPPGVRYDARVVSLPEIVVSGVRRALWVLLASVGLVVLAACANVANLLLAQMTVRVREVVTHAALGASRSRIVRQCLAESLMLGLLGGLAGAIVASPVTNALVSLGASYLPRAHEVALDWSVFAFLFVVCVTISMLFGLAPALAASRVDVVAITKAGAQQTVGRRFGRMRDGLAVIEVAAAAVLALGALFVIREAVRLEQVPAGMTSANVLTLHLVPAAPAATYQAIVDRVSTLPGVRSAGVTQMIPLQHWGWDADFRIRGRDSRDRLVTELRYVSPEYFRTLDIQIRRGRGFTAQDVDGAPRVIVINDALARRYFPGEDPIGVETDRGTIVGVIADVRQVTLAQAAVPEIYYPIAQNVAAAGDIGMSLVVRAEAEPAALGPSLRAAIAEVAPSLAVFNIRTMEEIRRDSLTEIRLYRWVIGLFATLALTLAVIGLAGIISFHVTSRQREFAVRLAIGADPSALVRLVVGRALRLVGVGLAGGAVAALLLTPIARALPGATTALRDPLNYAIVAVAVALVAILACLAPALRIVRLNPNVALREG